MVKRTGPSKVSTRLLVVKLEKYGKKHKQDVWLDLSERLGRSRRRRAEVNLFKLSQLGAKLKEKIFVVPGKVLGEGELAAKVNVAALAFSSEAKEKIKNAKGSSMSFEELIALKPKAADLMIVE